MNILVTAIRLVTQSGVELFTRDLAVALQTRGHKVAVYTPSAGRLADVMRDEGITISNDLHRLPFSPDIIHGQHVPALLQALSRFPTSPALQIVHDATASMDEPIIFPRIRRYVAVDDRCLARILQIPGIAPDRSRVILNFVDLARFSLRSPLPERPKRALVFSNYANGATHLPAIRKACRRSSLPLDVIGEAAGKVSENPGESLTRYDLIFAKGRCALEAMAAGAAVVVCDSIGLGPMVTTKNFDRLRRMNFGAGVLVEPLAPDAIIGEIQKYNAADASEVTHRIRREADLDTAVEEWLMLYREILAEGAMPPDNLADKLCLEESKHLWRPALGFEQVKRVLRKAEKIPFIGGAIIAILHRLWRLR